MLAKGVKLPQEVQPCTFNVIDEVKNE